MDRLYEKQEIEFIEGNDLLYDELNENKKCFLDRNNKRLIIGSKLPKEPLHGDDNRVVEVNLCSYDSNNNLILHSAKEINSIFDDRNKIRAITGDSFKNNPNYIKTSYPTIIKRRDLY